MKRVAIFATGVLGGAAVLLLAGGLLLTATGPGQQALLGLASWALSSETMAVETGELSGSLFGEGQISRITISDADGRLMELERIGFLWSPFDLFEERVSIESLRVARVDMRRLPAGKQPKANLTGDTAFDAPSWLAGEALPLSFAIDHLHIAEAAISEKILGAPARLSLSGHVDARNPEEVLSASVSVQDMDRASFATAHAEYRADARELHLAANAEEKAGGVLSTLLDIENGQNLKLELEGNGAWELWRGDWLAAVDSERMAGGSLIFSGAEDKLSLEVEADGEIGRFLPTPYASLLTGKSNLDLKVDYLGEEKFRLDTLTLDAPHIKARADGTANFTNYTISGAGRIRLGEGPGGEPASIALAPETDLSIKSAEIVFDTVPGNRETELEAVFEAAGLAMNGKSIESLSAKARITQLGTQPTLTLSDFVMQHPRAELRQEGSARLQKSGQRYTLDGLVLHSGEGQLSADAVIDNRLGGRIALSALPLSIAEVFAPDLALNGTLDGKINLNGTANGPKAEYNLTFSDVSEPQLLPLKSAKFDLSATGQFAGESLTIDAKASGPDGMTFSAGGAINDLGDTNALQLTAKGAAPLGLANSFLAHRGTQVAGETLVDLSVSGRAHAPLIDGSIAVQGATVSDPATGISLTDASLAASLYDGKLHVTKLNARSKNGGTVEASGTLDISTPSKRLPASFTFSTDDFKFSDGRIVAGQASSAISLEGDFRDEVRLSGSADIARLDVRIPRALPASVTALELKHKNAPEHVRAAHHGPEERDETDLPARIKLSLDVRSANRIFVTGRGLDAQLGGRLQLSGSADDPRAIGQFTLERGNMAVLGRSLDFTSGALDFSGDLDPRLNFKAVTKVDSTTITVTVSGKASQPQFGFSSQPELPDDEILALLLFDKSFGELSPVQLAQLAAQVSELGGLTGVPGVVDQLKSSLGVDRLNVTTTEEGEVAVTAGSSLNENLFVGVEQATGSKSSRVQIDLDISKNIKIRGEAGADGESKLGVGFEWEY